MLFERLGGREKHKVDSEKRLAAKVGSCRVKIFDELESVLLKTCFNILSRLF